MFVVLSYGSDRKMVLFDGYRCGWLKNGNRVFGDFGGYLVSYRLDYSVGSRDGGKRNGGFFF